MSNQAYDIALKKLADALLNLGTADIRALLLKDTYVFDPTHQFVADVIAGSKEISVMGYARLTLSGLGTSLNSASHRAEAAAADLNFGDLAVGQTMGACILAVHVTNDADSWLLGFVNTGGFPKATNGRNVTIKLPSGKFAHILGS